MRCYQVRDTVRLPRTSRPPLKARLGRCVTAARSPSSPPDGCSGSDLVTSTASHVRWMAITQARTTSLEHGPAFAAPAY